MGESLITRRAGGGEATITFENYSPATNLTYISASDLSLARRYLAGASVGEYALFAGGYNGNSIYSSTVDAYCDNLELSLFPNTKYKLNDMPSEQTSTSFQTLSIPKPVNGYMKIQNATLQN